MQQESDIIRFSVSLPEKLLDALDKKVAEQGYASRSEFTRDLIREKIIKDDWQEDDSEVIGVLTLIYSHQQNELVQKILTIQHDAKLTSMCTSHVSITPKEYLETLTVKGKVIDVKDFTQKIAGLKGVTFCQLVEASIPAS